MRRFATWVLGCTLFTALTAAPLPDLGGSGGLINQHQAKNMGADFMRQVRQQLPLVHDPLITDYIQRLGNYLVTHSPAKGQHFHFFVVDDDSVNAFAGPGGYIGVNAGLITTAKNESELASVMAHEIGHVVQHHLQRMTRQAKLQAIPAMVAALAGFAAGGQAGTAAVYSAAAAHQTSMLTYSRDYEREADQVGQETLNNSGYDPHAMPIFFYRMQESTQFYPEPPPFLSSHPVTSDRIADSKTRADKLARKRIQAPKNTGFYFVKTLLTTRHSQNLHDTLSHYMKTDNIYGQAITEVRLHRLLPAKKQLIQLHQQAPKNVFYAISLARIDLQQQQEKVALSRLSKLQSSPAVAETKIQALSLMPQTADTLKQIRHLVAKYPQQLSLLQSLAQAEANAGHKADAYFYQGLLAKRLGNKAQAAMLFNRALKQTDLTPDLQQQIRTYLTKEKKHDGR